MQAEPTSNTPKTALSEATFAPMPLRRRNILEVLDMAIKAFKQYFWVLLGWGAVTNAVSVIGSLIPGFNYVVAFFTPPAVIGACACSIAAAVRGQRVEFKQCWQFTKPRYWPMVGMYVLSSIIAFLIIMVSIVVLGLMFAGGALLVQNAPSGVKITLAVIGGIVLGLIASVVFTGLFVWQGIVCVVVCMEEDKRNSNALARGYELLRGYWMPTISLMMVLGLGMLALWAILGAAGAAIVGIGNIRDLLSGTSAPTSSVWAAVVLFGISSLLLWMLYSPLYYLTLNLLYLDLRIRKEALDLEWTAHATAPLAPVGVPDATGYAPNAYPAQPGNFTPVTGFVPNSNIAPPTAPNTMPPGPITPGTMPPNTATQYTPGVAPSGSSAPATDTVSPTTNSVPPAAPTNPTVPLQSAPLQTASPFQPTGQASQPGQAGFTPNPATPPLDPQATATGSPDLSKGDDTDAGSQAASPPPAPNSPPPQPRW